MKTRKGKEMLKEMRLEIKRGDKNKNKTDGRNIKKMKERLTDEN